MNKLLQRVRPRTLATPQKGNPHDQAAGLAAGENMRRKPISQGEYIEKALVETYGLSPATM